MELARDQNSVAGLYLNIKTKIMSTREIKDIWLNGEKGETVESFIFLHALISDDTGCDKEIKRRTALGKAAMHVLTKKSGKTEE